MTLEKVIGGKLLQISIGEECKRQFSRLFLLVTF
jgi:hypothetical protein